MKIAPSAGRRRRAERLELASNGTNARRAARTRAGRFERAPNGSSARRAVRAVKGAKLSLLRQPRDCEVAPACSTWRVGALSHTVQFNVSSPKRKDTRLRCAQFDVVGSKMMQPTASGTSSRIVHIGVEMYKDADVSRFRARRLDKGTSHFVCLVNKFDGMRSDVV